MLHKDLKSDLIYLFIFFFPNEDGTKKMTEFDFHKLCILKHIDISIKKDSYVSRSGAGRKSFPSFF